MTNAIFASRRMKTLHKFLSIAFLAVSVFITRADADPVGTQNPSASPATTQKHAKGASAKLPLVQIPRSKYLRFGHITTEDGLSSDTVWGIAQDHRGFMWFGTFIGLNRFDGSDIKVYKHNPNDPFSLSADLVRDLLVDSSGVLWIGTWSNGLNQFDPSTERFIRYQFDPEDPFSVSHDQIRAIHEDSNGFIWVGTLGGLNKLDPATNQFTRYLHDPDDPDSLGNNVVWSVYEDRFGILWVGTGGGLDRFEPATETFVHYVHDPEDPHSLSQNAARSIVEDGTGTLWVGTMGGLNRFDRQTEQFTRYQYDPADPDSLSHNAMFMVNSDQAGNLWVGTWGGGLNRFDRDTDTFTRYQKNASDPYSISSNQIYSMHEDQTGVVWFSTEDGGVNFLDAGGKPFRHYRAIGGDPTSMSANGVRSLFADQNGIVWVGTSSGGFNRFDSKTEEFTHYRHDPQEPNSLSSDAVIAIYRDQEGMLWAGGWGSGLNRYDPDTNTFTIYKSDQADPRSLSNNSITAILEDRLGTLWIGTWGGGLNALDRETGQFTRYQYDPAAPGASNHLQVYDIYEDRRGVIWLGTMAGLYRFNRESETFFYYPHDPTDPKSAGKGAARSIYEDRSGRLWISAETGLHLFDRESEQFKHYTTQDGLPGGLWGTLEDAQGNLWISTVKGLSKFNPESETFRNYDVSDGLQSDSFSNYETFGKTPNGEMFFGGTYGVTAFFPDQISDNPHPPPVVITDFQMANKPVSIGDDSVLKKSILETDELVLSYLDTVFSFNFAALNYRASEKNRYKYKMEGFEEEWNEVDSTQRFATYTNLDSGDYVFRVIASNNDGVWNEDGASVKITITPPWWETLWFRIIMAVAAAGLLVGGFRWRVSAIEARSRKLEIQVADRTKELQQAKEAAETASQAKSTFLANMSHELRTPLHAILGFTRIMTRDSKLDKEHQERLDIINRSGEHLLDMINDILNLSKIEAGRIELKNEVFDLTRMVQDVAQLMKSRAEGKGLRFTLERDLTIPLYIKGDAGKLRQILINLLGNAVKFTETGDVWLRAHSQPMADDPDMVKLQFEVQDCGPGIPQDKKNAAFEAFIQLSHSQKTEKGTGLGLAISKTLVEMMNGEILLESEPGQGTLLTVTIPFHLTDAVTAEPVEKTVAEVVGLEADQPEWRILVVDDNLENRILFTTLLTRIGCRVKEANNGEEAISLYQEWHPHFIWMDMRMPVLDGFATTRKIRTLPGGDAVRIVAVTASVLEERHNEILACGCDEVVRKPFKDLEIFEAMARQLEIKYVYKDRGEVAAQKQEIHFTADMLVDIPEELLQELREKTLALNMEAILEVIEGIAEYAPDTAETLRALVQNFQIDQIREVLLEAR
jgi:signal transduction histidine kinase/streptogramin lyase/CheY-like chemotaxis protein